MAEVLGLISEGAGLASLTIQILESTRRLAEFYSTVRNAPNELRSILEEINILANVIVGLSQVQSITGSGQADSTTLIQSDTIRHCKAACECLSTIVSSLEAGTRAQPKWFSTVAALKTKQLDKLLIKLERAKSTLVLAQILYLQLLQIEASGSHQCGKSTSALLHNPATRLERISTPPGDMKKPFVDYNTSYNLGICSFGIVDRKSSNTDPGSDPERQEFRFRLAPWLKMWGFSIIIDRQFGILRTALQPVRLVPGNSPIMKSCAMGDTEEVRRLIATKQASPHDTTYNDVTPLHVAAAWLRPAVCKLLLEMGADSYPTVRYKSCSWTAIQLAGERGGCYRPFLFPGLEELRPRHEESTSPMRETLRILLDRGQIETSHGYVTSQPGQWNGSTSVMHYFRGTHEDYVWLALKESEVDRADMDDYKASIVLQQTEMSPNDSFMAAFGKVTNMAHLVNFGVGDRTLLHYLLSSNWSPEPGIWHNGLEVFPVIGTLLRHGADPCAQDIKGRTPLVHAAQRSLQFVSYQNQALSCGQVSATYSRFLRRWVSVLKSCGKNLEAYCLQEQELGAIDFIPCSMLWLDKFHPLFSDSHWFVRISFQAKESPEDIGIEFEYRKEQRVTSVPGAWATGDELSEAHV